MKKPIHISPFSKAVLNNDGSSLDLFCLGHGAMSSETNTSYLVVSGDTSLLIDCGYMVPASLDRFGISPASISNMFITHAHPDHAGGISNLLSQKRYFNPAQLAKTSLWATRTWAQSLWNDVLSGDLSSHDSPHVLKDNGGDALSELPSSKWYDLKLPTSHGSFAGRDTCMFEKGGLKIETFRTMHTPASARSWQESAWSTGVLINGLIWISGDTRYDPDLVKAYAPRSRVMIHDACPHPDPVHASFESLSRLEVDIKCKMLLTHLKAGFDDSEACKQVKAHAFRGLALAGTKISVKYED